MDSRAYCRAGDDAGTGPPTRGQLSALLALGQQTMAAMWFTTMFGEVFGLPTWLLDALPFSAVPYLPLEPMS